MTTMNGAALAVAVAEQVVLDARRGIEDSAALIYALPGRAAGAALPLFERFRHAAEVKKEEGDQLRQADLLHAANREKREEEQDEQERHEHLIQDYTRRLAEFGQQVDDVKKHLGEDRHRLDAINSEAEGRRIQVNGRKVLIAKNGEFIFEDSSGSLEGKDRKSAQAQNEAMGGEGLTQAQEDSIKKAYRHLDETEGYARSLGNKLGNENPDHLTNDQMEESGRNYQHQVQDAENQEGVIKKDIDDAALSQATAATNNLDINSLTVDRPAEKKLTTISGENVHPTTSAVFNNKADTNFDNDSLPKPTLYSMQPSVAVNQIPSKKIGLNV